MDPTDRFGVRGCHPTLYKVELPPWLPRDLMKEMVAKFEDVLRDEIFDMMLENVRRNKARRPSGQSTSAMSTGSHRSNPTRAKYHDCDARDLTDIDYTAVIDD